MAKRKECGCFAVVYDCVFRSSMVPNRLSDEWPRGEQTEQCVRLIGAASER